MLGKLAAFMQEDECRLMSLTSCKNQCKIYYRCTCKTGRNGNGSEQRHSVGFIGYKQGQSQKWTKRL